MYSRVGVFVYLCRGVFVCRCVRVCWTMCVFVYVSCVSVFVYCCNGVFVCWRICVLGRVRICVLV